jgi:predicted GIY-YIG superfamily endonuclease
MEQRTFVYAMLHVTKSGKEEVIYAGETWHLQQRLRNHFNYRSLTEHLTRDDINRVNCVKFAECNSSDEAYEAETWLISLGTKCNFQKKAVEPSNTFDPKALQFSTLSSAALAQLKKRSKKNEAWDALTALTQQISENSANSARNYAATFSNLTSAGSISQIEYVLWDLNNRNMAELKSRYDDLYRRSARKVRNVYDRRCEEIMYTIVQNSVSDEMDKEIFMQYYGLGKDRAASVSSLTKQYGLNRTKIQQRIDLSTQKVKEALEKELKGGKTA